MLTIPMQVYLLCALLPVVAFLYLIYNFFFITKKVNQIEKIDITLYQHMISNIQGVICSECIHSPSLKTSSSDKQSICRNKQTEFMPFLQATDCCTQCVQKKNHKYLPHAFDGIKKMKQINKTVISQRKKQLNLVLKITKKRVMLNNLEKFRYQKTILPIIFEDLQY